MHGLSGGIKKKFVGLSDDAASAMGKMWRGKDAAKSIKEVSEQVTKELGDDIASALSKADDVLSREFRDEVVKLERLLEDSVNTANKYMHRSLSKLQTQKNNAELLIERIDRSILVNKNKLSNISPDDPGHKILLENAHNLITKRNELGKRYSIITDKQSKLSEIYAATTKGNQKQALQLLDNNPELIHAEPGVKAWRDSLVNGMRDHQRGMDAVRRNMVATKSKNIKSDSAFLKEYISLKSLPDGGKALSRWMANPANKEKLFKLQQSPRVKKIIDQGYVTLKQRILGVTPTEWAKRLGVAAAGVTAGSVGMYNWMADNDPNKVSNSAKKVSSMLSDDLMDNEVVAKTNKSLKRISDIAVKADEMMSENQAKAVEFYATRTAQELSILSGLIEQWPDVVESSQNPAKAKKTYEGLVKYANSLANMISNIGKNVGINIAKMDKQVVQDDNIVKVQNALGLKPTGKIDDATETALKGLEKKFARQSREKWESFDTSLVDRAVGHVVKYEDLINIINRMRKY
jgi:hypothetical protein